MPFEQFTITEAIANSNTLNSLPSSLLFSQNIKEEGRLLRLLLGTVKIRNNVKDTELLQNTNYSILGTQVNDKIVKKTLYNFLGSSYNINNLDSYLKKSEPRNINFFKEITNEFCFYFDSKHNDNNVVAFLHLYRLLERMSYTFPMLYAPKAKDYVGTWTKLQNYFKNSNSELKFFYLFINDFFDNNFLNYNVQLNITAFNQEIREKYFKVLKDLLANTDPNINIVAENQYADITIQNKDLMNLMICIRNRFFHFASGGQRNISTVNLIEPNDFFEFLNEHFINWLAFTYVEMVKKSIEGIV